MIWSKTGDNCGVSLPRACRTGLCGSCTCEVKDENAIDGFATIRACSANVFVPPGQTEMVIDVYRMRSGQVGGLGRKSGADTQSEAGNKIEYTDPMARFSGDWEKSFLSPSSAAAQWTQEDTIEDYELPLTKRLGRRNAKTQQLQTYPQTDATSTTPVARSSEPLPPPAANPTEGTVSAVPKEVMRALKAKSLSRQSGMGMRTEDITPTQPGEIDVFKLDFNAGVNTPVTAKMRGMWGDAEYLEVQTRANTNDGHFGGPKRSSCAKCKGSGRCVCYYCGGKGVAIQGGTNNPMLRQCLLCVGTCTVSCSTCQGEGYMKVKRKLTSK